MLTDNGSHDMQAIPQDSTANHNQGNVDAAEVAKFEALASRWWDPRVNLNRSMTSTPCALILLMHGQA
ncbi:hypothetical protein HSBAA_32210 [Vreelandella sulfidaeris]|uniref:3-demethylubiquinol 3-O-methyltransferase n=1 Tax=Vreelandella sulfidaeris TaxID=115553 RepID=A0A455U7I5_9GAMM|nr:hypothetical protein HSBAA_32210 [Halomonas sulfidaeris]